MGNYKFIHNFDGVYKVEVTTNAESSSEIVREFAAFLLGCQFHRDSIKDALIEVGEDLE